MKACYAAIDVMNDTLLWHCAGDHLCEERAALHGPGPAAAGAELPSHCHSQTHDAGRKVSLSWDIHALFHGHPISPWFNNSFKHSPLINEFSGQELF